MMAHANHHVGIRTADIERAARFYIDVFEGYWKAAPWVLEGEMAETVFGPHRGLRVKVCFIGLGSSTLELFEFLEPAYPVREVPQVESGLMHFAIQVDNVEATAAKAVEAGARMMFAPTGWGETSATYLRDLDGNVIEVINIGMDRITEIALELFPEADPANAPF